MSESLTSQRSEDSIKYEEVAYGFEGANVFSPRSSRYGARFQMGVFFLVGIMLMLAHHFLYTYLDGEPVDSYLFSIHGFSLSDQSVSSLLGNAIAYVARTVLSSGIGIVFIQVLWSKLRRKQFSVEHIDALVACKGEPFTLSALPTWHYAFWLAAIAAMATLMAFISIIAPGSLSVVSSNFSFPVQCTVRTISLENANIGSYAARTNSSDKGLVFAGAQARLMILASQVLASGAAAQPPNPCPGACQYEITFNAPVASCSPVNSTFDYNSWLPPPDNDTAPIRVWNSQTSPSVGIWTVVATRDVVTNSQSAVNCTTYNATYHALITHTNTSTSVIDVYRTDILNQFTAIITSALGSQSPEDYTGMQYDAIITAFSDVLSGVVNYYPGLQEYSYGTNNFFVPYSPVFTSSAGSSDVPWTSTSNLSMVLPSLMQNISVSLLANQLSTDRNSTTTPIDTTCWYSSSAYSYNEIRLLATYGAALVITMVCMLFGFRAVRLNGAEESVAFSRILGALLNKPLFNDRYELSRSSQLTANGSPDGQLRLVHTTYGQNDE